MKMIMTGAIIFFVMFVVGCGSEKNTKQVEPAEPPIPKITRAEAQTKLAELSTGLEVYYDDMKSFTIFRCHHNSDNDSVIVLTLLYTIQTILFFYVITYFIPVVSRYISTRFI